MPSVTSKRLQNRFTKAALRLSDLTSVRRASRTLGVSPGVISHIRRKRAIPNLHTGSWGGVRSGFSVDDRAALQKALWKMYKRDRTLTVKGYHQLLQDQTGIRVSPSWIQKKFESWNLSWKRGVRVQQNKFTPSNLRIYFSYLQRILEEDLSKVKFMDESHFDGRSKFLPYCTSHSPQ